MSNFIITHEQAQRAAQEVLEGMKMLEREREQAARQEFLPDLNVVIDKDGGTVAVGVHVTVLGYEHVEVGSAKCHPNDTFNSEMGLALAAARAFRRMANELERSVAKIGVWDG